MDVCVSTMQPWQLDMMKKIQDAIKPGEMAIMMSGRGVGKSVWTNKAVERLIRDLNSRPIEELRLSEGKVYGARYHCVEPVGGSWPDMEAWCFETFGDCGDNMWGERKAPKPGHRWYMNNRKFWFREVKDRDWFIMRWSSS